MLSAVGRTLICANDGPNLEFPALEPQLRQRASWRRQSSGAEDLRSPARGPRLQVPAGRTASRNQRLARPHEEHPIADGAICAGSVKVS